MAKVHTSWRVLPHGSIEKLSDRLWRVEGALENMPLKRVMTIARRTDGGLVVHNAIALADDAMAELARWGEIRWIVVPNGYHRLDAKVFLDRFPSARVLCPEGARAKVEQVVAVAGGYGDMTPDAAVELQTLDGTKQREGAMIVRADDGTSVVLNDVVFNMPHVRGAQGFVLRLLGSSGGPKVTRIARLALVADKAAVRAHLERLAGIPDLRRIVVSHHETIAAEPARILGAVAATL